MKNSNKVMNSIIVTIAVLLAINTGFCQTSTGNGTYISVLKIAALENAPAYFYIDTNIPATDQAAPQLQITGYMYHASNKAMKITLGWYYYAGDFYWTQFQSDLGYNKPSRVRIGKYTKDGTGYIRIEIANNSVYWSNYTISATDRSNFASYYTGWTYAEGEMPTSTTSQITVVNQQKDVIVDGAIGIGSASPVTPLHVTGGAAMTSGWNKTATLQATYPVQIFNSNSSKWAGIGYDFGNAMKIWVNASSDDVNGTGITALTIKNNGDVGIGAAPQETYKLAVNGNIRAKKLVVETGWSDYVFNSNYKLRSLSSLESFIKQNKHLPEVPSAKEVEEKGISVGDNQALLLKKIEELTLYLIGQQKQLEKQQQQIQQQSAEIKKLKQRK